MDRLFLGLIQLAVALLLSGIAAYLAFYLFQWFTRDLDEWEELRSGNTAVGLVLGSMLVSVAIVLRPAFVLNTVPWDIGSTTLVQALLAEAVQLAVGLVLAVISLTLSLYLFAALTPRLEEVEELRNGNLAIACLLAGVMIAVGLMVSQAVGQVMGLVLSVLF